VTTPGFCKGNLKTAKHWTDGWHIGQRKCSSFFPLGFLMHPSSIVDVVFVCIFLLVSLTRCFQWFPRHSSKSGRV
jgi:hypothetical protein